jgi:hypothetical protein
VGFNSFGVVGECGKHQYAPSPTVYNAFFLQARPKTLICSSQAFAGSFKVAFSLLAFLILAVGECAE